MQKFKKYAVFASILVGIYLILCSFFPNNGNSIDSAIFIFLKLSFLVALIAIYIFFIIYETYKEKSSGRNILTDLHRSDTPDNLIELYHFMKAEEASKNKYTTTAYPALPKEIASGIVLGKDSTGRVVVSKATDETHIFCLGQSGLGKSSAYLEPTLQIFPGNIFAIDTVGTMRENGKRPNSIMFDVLNQNSTPYNPLYLVDAADNRTIQLNRIKQLVYIMMPDLVDGSGNANYFHTNGRDILNAAFIYYYDSGLDFPEMCTKFVTASTMELINEIWNRGADEAATLIASHRDANETNTAGCHQAAAQKVLFFAENKIIQKNFRRPLKNEVSISPDKIETNDIFVTIPQEYIKTYDSVIRIIIEQSMEYISMRDLNYTKPILFMLDELGLLNKISQLPDALHSYRKRHCRIFCLTQSIASIERIYGKSMCREMMDDFGIQILLSAVDPESQDYYSRKIGEYDRIKYNRSWHGSSQTLSTTTEKSRIVPAADLAYLGKNEEAIIFTPSGTMRLNKYFLWREGDFRRNELSMTQKYLLE